MTPEAAGADTPSSGTGRLTGADAGTGMVPGCADWGTVAVKWAAVVCVSGRQVASITGAGDSRGGGVVAVVAAAAAGEAEGGGCSGPGKLSATLEGRFVQPGTEFRQGNPSFGTGNNFDMTKSLSGFGLRITTWQYIQYLFPILSLYNVTS